jgi:hypothetical protein
LSVAGIDPGESHEEDFLAWWRACSARKVCRYGAIMLIGLVFRFLREPYSKALVTLPSFSSTKALPAEIDGVRFSLMRALQGVLSTSLHQFGLDEPFQYYSIGGRVLQPVLAKVLISHGWVTSARPHWAEAVIQYSLSADGYALKNELENWWHALTLGQRLRAVLVE